MRSIDISPLCCLCNEEVETTNHCLLHCRFFSIVWFASHLCIRTTHDSNILYSSWFSNWFNVECNSKEDKYAAITFIAILSWNIWKAQNTFIFEKKMSSMPNILSSSYRLLNESREVIQSLKNGAGVGASFWTPPPFGCLKINVDKTFYLLSNWADLGLLVCDDRGHFVCLGRARLDFSFGFSFLMFGS